MTAPLEQAGAVKATKAKKKPPKEGHPVKGLPQQPGADPNGMSPFARALGSRDYATREKGLQAVQHFMQRKANLSELDMMKIWKGIFYCFWHSDKAPVQVTSGWVAAIGAYAMPVQLARPAPACAPVDSR
jgi:hypothetical protein